LSNKNGNGNGNNESRLFKRNGDSNNNQPFKKEKRTQCTIYKKFHKSECFFKSEPDTESNTKTNGSKFTVKQYVNFMQSMMANAPAFQPNKKKKRKVTMAESKDEKENIQVNNNDDLDGCESDNEQTRSAMCQILGRMWLQLKKTTNIRQQSVRTTVK
jgi:hypothetical protein